MGLELQSSNTYLVVLTGESSEVAISTTLHPVPSREEGIRYDVL